MWWCAGNGEQPALQKKVRLDVAVSEFIKNFTDMKDV